MCKRRRSNRLARRSGPLCRLKWKRSHHSSASSNYCKHGLFRFRNDLSTQNSTKQPSMKSFTSSRWCTFLGTSPQCADRSYIVRGWVVFNGTIDTHKSSVVGFSKPIKLRGFDDLCQRSVVTTDFAFHACWRLLYRCTECAGIPGTSAFFDLGA